MLTVSTAIKPALPILFHADVNSPPGTGGGPGGVTTMEMTIAPLDAKDRKTVVGPPFTFGGPLDADAHFASGFGIAVPAAANPVTNSLIEVNLTLIGSVCNLDFICGDVEGQIWKPGFTDLKGSTFTLQKYMAPGAPPNPPLINCAKQPADPPPP